MSSPSPETERYGWRRLALLSIPAMGASALEPLAGIVDTAFLGQIESRYVAALAISVTILSSFTWIFNFLLNGVTAQVAQAVGKRDREGIAAAIGLALVVAVVSGTVTALALIGLYQPIVEIALGADPSLRELGREYFVIRAIGLPFVLATTAIMGALRGLQRIALSLWLQVLVTLANVVLTYVLLFVFEMGLAGAAIGTTASFALGTLVGLGILLWRRDESGLRGLPRIGRAHLAAFGGDAGNLVMRTGSLLLAFFVATSAATRLGEIELAAHQIAFQLWLFSSFLIDGFAITANMVGARLFGAGELAERRRVGAKLLTMGALAGGAFAVGYLALRAPLQGVFTRDSEVLRALGAIWPILALTQPMNGLVYVYDGLLFGERAFAYLRRHMMLALGAAFAPVLALAMWLDAGLVGVWLAFIALNGYRCVSCAARFHRAGFTTMRL